MDFGTRNLEYWVLGISGNEATVLFEEPRGCRGKLATSPDEDPSGGLEVLRNRAQGAGFTYKLLPTSRAVAWIEVQ